MKYFFCAIFQVLVFLLASFIDKPFPIISSMAMGMIYLILSELEEINDKLK